MHSTANVSALGYGAFALTLWLASMEPAGWFPQSGGNFLLVLSTAVLGGCVLALAGLLRWSRGGTFDTLLFLAFAGYWWIAALNQHALAAGTDAAASADFRGWYCFAWALLAAGLWLAALRRGTARMLFALGLALSLLAYAAADWAGLEAFTLLGGYVGLVTAVVGIYIAAAEAVNATHGHVLLPLGEAATTPPAPRSAPRA